MANDAVAYAKKKTLSYRSNRLQRWLDDFANANDSFSPNENFPHRFILDIINENNAIISSLIELDDQAQKLGLIKYDLADIRLYNDYVLMSIDVARNILKKIRENCVTSESYLDYTPLSKENVKEVVIFTEELTKLEKEIKNTWYIKTMKEAVDEIANYHKLAGAMIAGKVAAVVFSKISKEGDIDQKIKILRQKGLLPPDRNDIRENIIKSSKFSRDYISHDPNTNPEINEVMGFIANTITTLKICKDILNE